MLICGDLSEAAIGSLLACYSMCPVRVVAGAAIPGSYWGVPEAGLIGDAIYYRDDTPVHSLLHETAHYICATPSRRRSLHTDAGGDDLEESAACYLQLLLADLLPGVERERLFRDMDDWGYSFRLGTTLRWFEEDAADARLWLVHAGILGPDGLRVGSLRAQL